MAVGAQIGEFEMQSTSITLEPGKGNMSVVHVNFEGKVTGDFSCTAIATMTVDSPDGKDGNYKISARCFMDDGEIIDATGEGKTTRGDGHTWIVAGVAKMSDGSNAGVQGEIDLATRTFSGRMFERN